VTDHPPRRRNDEIRKSRIDPDLLLGHMRAGIATWEASQAGSREEQEAAERATAAMATMDDWLSKGGELPSEWLAALAGVGPAQRQFQGAYQQMLTAEGKHHALTWADLERAFRAAFRALVEKNAEVQRLNAELDGYRGHQVFHATEAQALQIAAAGAPDDLRFGSQGVLVPPGAADGAILRATDTGREWVKRGENWEDRERGR
jgi:hypothetical protein